MKKALILGATSAIAEATARRLAAQGASLYLVARSAERLESIRSDLLVRGAAAVHTQALDLTRTDAHPGLVDQAFAALGGCDLALLSYGILGDQTECEREWAAAESVIATNFTSAASLLGALAPRFEAQRGGVLVALSSVAGDRGRQSNYVYGAAKGGLSVYLQGLRHRLHASGVRVITIKPGFVDTPMTAHLPKNALFASPDRIAGGILRAAQKGQAVAYLPFFWRWIMLLIRALPDFVFVKTKL